MMSIMKETAVELQFTMPTQTTPAMKALSACCGSLVTGFFVTPFDVIKTRLQTQPSSAVPLSSTNLHGTFDAIVKIPRQEGIRGLWRGLGATLTMSLPATTFYMVGYETWKESMQSGSQPGMYRYDLAPLVAGSAARTLAAVLVSPIELVRTRIQQAGNERKPVRVILNDAGHMVKQHGYRSLWTGLSPTLWRDVPFSALYWYGYEQLRLYLLAQHSSPACDSHAAQPFTVWDELRIAFTAGACSGMFAAFVTTPFDVAKSRRQMEWHPRATEGFAGRTNTSMAPGVPERRILWLLMSIYKEEGWSGLMKGWLPRLAKVAPSCAIMISSYEFGKYVFRKMQ